MEKIALAQVHATRKLSHYFQAHTVYVLTEHPLQSFLRRLDFTRRIAKWGTRLGSFNIRYKPRNAIKGQMLVDFVVEFTPAVGDAHMVCKYQFGHGMYVDRASNARALVYE